jgi:hypothetical protein
VITTQQNITDNGICPWDVPLKLSSLFYHVVHGCKWGVGLKKQSNFVLQLPFSALQMPAAQDDNSNNDSKCQPTTPTPPTTQKQLPHRYNQLVSLPPVYVVDLQAYALTLNSLALQKGKNAI